MPTISDVAKLAGVSISTVSYALSGKRPVSPPTRQKISEAIDKLGFEVTAGARMLASSKTGIFALCAPLHSHTYPISFMTFVLAIAKAAREEAKDLLLITEDQAESVKEIRRLARSQLIDGAILMDVSRDDVRCQEVSQLGIPAVFIGIPKEDPEFHCVDLDLRQAAFLAIDELANHGHTSVGFLGHPRAIYEKKLNFAYRTKDAFFQMAHQKGMSAQFYYSEEESIFQALQASILPFSALVFDCGENFARQVINYIRNSQNGALTHSSLGTPLSLLSLASSYDTDTISPPVDTIPLEAEKSGRLAVHLLNGQVSKRTAPAIHLYEPRYLHRGSLHYLDGGEK